ncbi:MAG: hypothetical protein JWO79_3850 [Actinomycetia bacterium]|nr:hypothetical protein [Actinomycetes bacterium]
MKRIIHPVLLLAGVALLTAPLAPAAQAKAPQAKTPQATASTDSVEVYTGDLTPAQLGSLRALGLDQEDIATSKSTVRGRVRAEVPLTGAQASALRRGGLPLGVKKVRGKPASAAMAAQAAAGFTVFRSYSEPGGIKDELVQTAADHPDLTKLETIGKTVQGKDIVAIKVTKNARAEHDGARPPVLYSAAQHAREWITPEMDRRLLHYYLDHYGTDPSITKIVDSTELWFIPVANPDGYDWTFTPGQRMWRKNLRDNDGDGKITAADGVDPNRNFQYRWGYDNEGSSPNPSSETYRGTGPASEPETQALDGLLKRVKPKFMINYHSAAQLLLYGAGWQVATPTPDDLVYQALAGDPAHSAVPGYEPEISAQLYTTNGDADGQAHVNRGTLTFTPEMSTCETAANSDPNDSVDPADCTSVFAFPDDEKLIQAEFTKNIPFALSVAKSAQRPDDPVSSLGLKAPDFQIDPFTVSYGDPQPVAVWARRAIQGLKMHYRINSGADRVAAVREWAGGQRYGADQDKYYAEFRGEVHGAHVGDHVEVWFAGKKPGSGPTASKHFTYRLAKDSSAKVLVLANEDYTGVNPTYPAGTHAPKYAKTYQDALKAAGHGSEVWDVDKQGVPHDLGVLSHFKAVVWYLGDNRLTQDPADEQVPTPTGPLTDAAVAERQQYLTMAVRDYLNEGGRLLHTGETSAYYGSLGTTVGGIYYGLDGAPAKPCAITSDYFSDCLLLADDFSQYYLGADSRVSLANPATVVGSDKPLRGIAGPFGGAPSNPLNEAGAFSVTSDVLPVKDFPQFRSWASSDYTGVVGPYEPVEGSWFAAASHRDDSWFRLSRTVDLTAQQRAELSFALSYDTESGYDNVIVEAHTAGQDDWTTLAEKGGATSETVPAECEAGFLIAEHPFLTHYLTAGNPCRATGSSGAWHSFTGSSNGWKQVAFDLSAYAGKKVEVSISYVTDPGGGGTGVFVDRTSLTTPSGPLDTEGFETSLGPWSAAPAPEGSPAGGGSFARSQAIVDLASSVSTPHTVLLGFGVEQLARKSDRVALLKQTVGYLLR